MGEEIIKREGGGGVGEWEKDTWTDDVWDDVARVTRPDVTGRAGKWTGGGTWETRDNLLPFIERELLNMTVGVSR